MPNLSNNSNTLANPNNTSNSNTSNPNNLSNPPNPSITLNPIQPNQMSTTGVTNVNGSGMPNVHHPSAPKFNGKAISLAGYLDEVEQLTRNHNLSIQQIIQWAIRYLAPEEQQLWKMLPSSTGNDWAAFKKDVFKCYPGTSEEHRYTISTLKALIDRQAEFKVTTSEQFGVYYRSFYMMSTYLKNAGKINDREISHLFLQGLHSSFHKQVRDQLYTENPRHHTDDPFTIDQIQMAALFILSSASMEPIEPMVKKEHFDFSGFQPQTNNGFNVNNLVEEIMKQVETLMHNDYIQKGLCKKNNDNFIVLPNGLHITPRTAPGKNLQECIDNWNRTHASKVPTVSTNMLGATTAPVSNWVMPNSTPVTSNIVELQLEEDEEIATATIREMEDLQITEALIASTQKKVNEA
ncbi:hypothetical protein CPB84DRAFT_1847113 [Gymnopilus junonius]|uniref:Uncharacterized protein n=1 Tax=Gymnopilus junonius TaxID=109634 RepID=A0A9P5NQU8_GYMJU|nr:hypothetical protein CPB84DRAFT_1847113 [Gymnopilus junonius]